MAQVNTIEDIAKLAGVSKSTVSRALNDSPLLKEDTKKHIRAIADKHNFVINYGARLLSKQKSNTIALMVPTIDEHAGYIFNDPFFRELVAGIANALSEHRYDLLVGQTRGDATDQINHYIASKRVDGIILIPCVYDIEQIVTLYGQKIPLIVWGTEQPSEDASYCTLNSDNFTGGFLATQHLINCGRKNIAYLGGPKETSEIKLRLEGYKKALKGNKLPLVQKNIVFTSYSSKDAHTAMLHLLEHDEFIDGVFVNCDIMAFGAIEAIRQHKRRIPGDISIVGYDDIPLAAYYNPPLTTIRQNISQVGKQLVVDLMKYINTGKTSHTTIPVQLIERKSSKV